MLLWCRVFCPPSGEALDLVDLDAEARLLAPAEQPACPAEVHVGAHACCPPPLFLFLAKFTAFFEFLSPPMCCR